ncbi:MAG: Coq4 family protein [Myxococcaceae bacterium]|nr:Coq4 family protein [Myxococcaceae bacterium]
METLREARRVAFERAGIPPDGGDSEPWVDFKLGPLPMPFPNTDARRRAVKLHDLHHVLTGYRTDILGEFEISAWEIAAGCGRFPVAWLLNLMGLTAGLVVAPRRIVRAFTRGAHSRALYTTLGFDAVIDEPVEAVRQRLGISAADARLPLTAKVLGQLLAAALAGLSLGVVVLAVILTPVTLLVWVLTYSRYRSEKRRAFQQAAAPPRPFRVQP